MFAVHKSAVWEVGLTVASVYLSVVVGNYIIETKNYPIDIAILVHAGIVSLVFFVMFLLHNLRSKKIENNEKSKEVEDAKKKIFETEQKIEIEKKEELERQRRATISNSYARINQLVKENFSQFPHNIRVQILDDPLVQCLSTLWEGSVT